MPREAFCQGQSPGSATQWSQKLTTTQRSMDVMIYRIFGMKGVRSFGQKNTNTKPRICGYFIFQTSPEARKLHFYIKQHTIIQWKWINIKMSVSYSNEGEHVQYTLKCKFPYLCSKHCCITVLAWSKLLVIIFCAMLQFSENVKKMYLAIKNYLAWHMFTKEIFREIYCKCSILNITKWKRKSRKFYFHFLPDRKTFKKHFYRMKQICFHKVKYLFSQFVIFTIFGALNVFVIIFCQKCISSFSAHQRFIFITFGVSF